ncbi:MAG: filamentous hemagglutinin N-terminal domain-containing protein [Methylophilaceae bacterium]
MNKIYSIVWSEARQGWVVAHESARRHGKPSTTRKLLVGALMSSLIATSVYADPPPVNTLPTGGQVAPNQAVITQSGNTLNINQITDKASINWNSFSIGSAATVNFIQPSASSVAINRVTGSDASNIYGRLNANGQVFLINPNGILFGRGASVNVGGLVASTMKISNADFDAGNYRFTGGAGSVVNQGELYGKYIALLAPEVRNENIIVARQGTVVMAAGKGITLNLVNNQLIDVMVEKADINTLVENKHLIQAEEGTVILSAQSANHLLGKVVNSGSIAAQGITSEGGRVRLTASSNIEHSGSINVDAGTNGKGGSAIVIADLGNANSRTDVSGSISARGGSVSGDGGFVETSASHLKIASTSHIDTRATNGKIGQWLLDPYDFTIGAAGDITGADLGTALDISNVTIQTTNIDATCTNATCGAGNAAGSGNIIFNDAVYWTADNALTLDAYRNIVFNQSVARDIMFGGSGPAIQMTYGTSGTGAAYTTSTADWVTPFVLDPFVSMLIQDNTSGGPIVTPAAILAAHSGLPLDLYLGAKNIPIFVNAVSGMSTYDGTAIPFTPTFSLDMPGAMPIDIIPPSTAGAPTFSTPNPTHAGTYAGVLYTGGLTSTAYDSLAAGNAGATWTINQATLTPTLTNSAAQRTKTYNGTNAAPVGFIPTYSFTGLVAGDTAAALSNTGATYDSFHTSATTLTVNGLAITGITGSNGSLVGDYVLSGMTVGATGIINPISLTANLTNVGTTKAYDGITAAPGGFTPTYSFTGSFLGGDTAATLSNTGSAYNNAHVASASTITTSGLAITGITGGNGSLSTDYALTAATATSAPGSATITPITLTLNPVLGASGTTTKVYDGTTAAPSGFTPGYNLTGVFAAGDTAANLTGTAAYNSKDVLSANAINVTGVHIIAGTAGITGSNGSLDTDYSLAGTSASFIGATITLATLSAVATGTKTDDGIDTIAGSLIKANGVHGEYFNFTGTGLLPDTLVDNKTTATGNLASVNTLALNTATGFGTQGTVADVNNYNAPPAYSATTDFNITVTSVATDLTAVDIIKRTIAAQMEKAKRGTDTTTTDFWKKINQLKGTTQDERDTVVQSVLKSVQKLCGPNCVVDEDTVAQVLGGLTGTPQQKQAKTPATPQKSLMQQANEITSPTNGKEIARLFVAYFGRLPDTEELAKWNNVIENQVAAGTSKDDVMVAVRNSLGSSEEYKKQYAGLNSEGQINKLYNNLFGHSPDPGGLLFWSRTLANGNLTLGQIAQAIAESGDTSNPQPTPTPSAPPSRTISQTNKDIKSVVEYFKDAGADNAKMANIVNIANNVGGAGNTPVTDEDIKWVTDYVNKQGKDKSPAVTVTAKEVEDWLTVTQAETKKNEATNPPTVVANKLKLTNNVDALNKAATDLEEKAKALANQIKLAEERDAANANAAAALAAERATRTARTAANAASPSGRINRSQRRAAEEAYGAASSAVKPAAIVAKKAADAADAAGAPATPGDLAKFKAALAETKDAAAAAKAAATANQGVLVSTDPELDVDKANNQADADLDAAKKALAKETKAEAAGNKKEFIAPPDLALGLKSPPLIDLGKKSAGSAAASALNADVNNNTPPPNNESPSVAQCVAAPTTPGCASVLPSISACVAAPSTPGCSAVLPSATARAKATRRDRLPESSAFEPELPESSSFEPENEESTDKATGNKKEFIAPPDLALGLKSPPLIDLGKKPAGSAAASALNADVNNTPPPNNESPSVAQCVAAPTTPGCSAVLPSVAACTAAPSTAGCSAVLPSLASCTTSPILPGCSAVLPASKPDESKKDTSTTAKTETGVKNEPPPPKTFCN